MAARLSLANTGLTGTVRVLACFGVLTVVGCFLICLLTEGFAVGSS